MAKDFFGSLGETLTKTAKELSGRAEEVYETQRLKNKISGEERQIEKAMADLGRIIYKRYKKEIPVDDAQKALCEQIDQRMEQIEKYKTDISELKVKNKRFCPSCGSPLAKDDAFCSQCGAACPTVEPEEEILKYHLKRWEQQKKLLKRLQQRKQTKLLRKQMQILLKMR